MGDLFDEAAERRLLERWRRSRSGCGPSQLDALRRAGARGRPGPGAAARDRGATGSPRSSSSARPAPARRRSRGSSPGVTGAEFEELSAVSATVANVREVLARARERLGATGRRTILFLDEIHRFNKAQQDALLPGVEEGLVTLIGATTENPYFELNAALLSRLQVYELEALVAERARARSSRRGAAELGVELDPERRGADRRARRRRRAQRALGFSSSPPQTARAEGAVLARAHVEDAARKRPLLYDRDGDAHYDTISAWIKSTRAGDVQASVYYLAVDARRRRGRALHRAADDHPRLRGHRQRRSAGAPRRGRRGAGGRARRAPEARLNLAQAADLPRAGAEVERLLPRARARRPPTSASTAGSTRPPRSARRPIPAAAQARPRQGLPLPARRPGGLRARLPARRAQGPRLLRPRAGEERPSGARGRRRRRGQRIRAPSALAASSTASAAVSFASSRIGFTSTSSSESSRPDSATSSSARCASR